MTMVIKQNLNKTKIFLALFILGVLVGPAWANDDYPRGEIFGGYSYASADAGRTNRPNLNGWGAGVSGHFNRYFGLTADLLGITAN